LVLTSVNRYDDAVRVKSGVRLPPPIADGSPTLEEGAAFLVESSGAILFRVLLFDEPSKQPLPTELTLEDHRLALIKGGLSALPLVGGALAEEMGLLLITPLARRRDEWWADVARRMLYLEGKVQDFKFENLGGNEQFVSAMIQATQSAARTHRKEKLEALRNAVLNIALGRKSAEDLQHIFLSLVDRFTPVHLELLRFFQHPNAHDRDRFRSERHVSDQAIMDLLSRGLIQDTRAFAAPGRDSEKALVINAWRISVLGKQFIDLVTNPPELS
jgi:hypothetical protein